MLRGPARMPPVALSITLALVVALAPALTAT
jgi:hypothetical protein